MTDFTCPRCGWPQGLMHSLTLGERIAMEAATKELYAEIDRALAAPQGQVDPYEALVMPHYPAPDDIAGLVERLRGLGKALRGLDWCDSLIPDEAADALERTRAYYDQMQQAYSEQKMLEAELTAAKAEIEEWKKKAHVADHNDAIARAENERLKEILAANSGEHKRFHDNMTAAQTEIARLRAALAEAIKWIEQWSATAPVLLKLRDALK